MNFCATFWRRRHAQGCSPKPVYGASGIPGKIPAQVEIISHI